CTVSGNHAAGNTAGGLTIRGGVGNLIGCTFSGNSTALVGGVLNDNASVWLTDCTVSGNSAGSGGVYTTGVAGTTLTNSTVSGNSSSSGSSVVNVGGATTWMNNTIVAGPTTGGNISGSVGGSNNLIGTGGSGGLVDGVNGNIVGVANPLLAPLGF